MRLSAIRATIDQRGKHASTQTMLEAVSYRRECSIVGLESGMCVKRKRGGRGERGWTRETGGSEVREDRV